MKDVRLAATVVGFCLIAPAAIAATADNASSAAAAKVRAVCQNCHGPGGNSTSATFPRLNGQQAAYIAAQIKKFRSHNRSDPHAMAYMWGMASQLDDATGDAIAKYLASKSPRSLKPGACSLPKARRSSRTAWMPKIFRRAPPVMATTVRATAMCRASLVSMPTT